MDSPWKPRLCFVGPLSGSRPGSGHVVMQGVRLSSHFRAAGHEVIAVSASPNRYLRLLDIAWTLIRERRQIDIIVLEVYGGPSFVVEDVASLLGHLFGHRIVLVLHGGAMRDFMASFPRWSRRVLHRADAIVAPSAFLARAVEPYGFRCQIIPNVIDIALYPHRLRREIAPRLFWMRSFHPVYNPLMAVRVLERLRATHPGATLVMGGQDKGMQEEVARYARSRGLAEAVRLPGFLEMEQKLGEGQAAEIFINTSHVDNMPVAVVEACALGLPVVTTVVGGIPDLLVDGETGLFCPDGDVDAMARSISRLLEEPGLAARLSAAGRRLAERSGWEQVRPQWELLFASLMPGADRGERGRRDVRR